MLHCGLQAKQRLQSVFVQPVRLYKVSTYLNGWKKSKEEYFVTCGDYMKLLKFWCPYVVVLECGHIHSFMSLHYSDEVERETIWPARLCLLSGSL